MSAAERNSDPPHPPKAAERRPSPISSIADMTGAGGWYATQGGEWAYSSGPPAEGWWLASDWRWYPPESLASVTPVPLPPPPLWALPPPPSAPPEVAPAGGIDQRLLTWCSAKPPPPQAASLLCRHQASLLATYETRPWEAILCGKKGVIVVFPDGLTLIDKRGVRDLDRSSVTNVDGYPAPHNAIYVNYPITKKGEIGAWSMTLANPEDIDGIMFVLASWFYRYHSTGGAVDAPATVRKPIPSTGDRRLDDTVRRLSDEAASFGAQGMPEVTLSMTVVDHSSWMTTDMAVSKVADCLQAQGHAVVGIHYVPGNRAARLTVRPNRVS